MPSEPLSRGALSMTAASDLHRPRARRKSLEASAVTRVALAIVDRDGLAGLTMRRIADELGVGLATLYNAAISKEAILLDMVDLVLGELPEPDRTPGREHDALIEVWTATHELLCAHPAVVQLGALQPIGGRRMFGLVEATLEMLRAGGVPEDVVPVAYHTLRSYVVGFTLLRISRTGPVAEQEERQRATMSRLPPELYPEVTHLAPALADKMDTKKFVAGLRHLLLGFTASSALRSV